MQCVVFYNMSMCVSAFILCASALLSQSLSMLGRLFRLSLSATTVTVTTRRCQQPRCTRQWNNCFRELVDCCCLHRHQTLTTSKQQHYQHQPPTTDDDQRRPTTTNTKQHSNSSFVRAFVCATFAVTATTNERRRCQRSAVSSGICRFPTLHGGCLLSNAVPNASSKQSANTRYCTRVCYISCCMVHTMKRTISPGPGLRALGCAVGCRCTRHATESVAVSAARSECLALRFAWGPRTETTPVGA